MDSLPCLEIGAARDDAEMVVLLMHGLGADANDFGDMAQALCQAAEPRKWRFVLPNAPSIPVTINGGMRMPAWYDLLDLFHRLDVSSITDYLSHLLFVSRSSSTHFLTIIFHKCPYFL